MKKTWSLPFLALVLLLVATPIACSSIEDSSEQASPDPTPVVTASASPSPSTPVEEEVTGFYSPLTGLPVTEEVASLRPVSIMLNNLSTALPQQGQSQADLIYECLTEGGITRMLAVYQDTSDLELTGSIRSSRPYYLELALGHDALYLHAGGSDDAYYGIANWGVDNFDCVNGPYEGTSVEGNLFWRDADRRSNLGYEHSVVTNGTAIATYIPSTTRLTHEEGYAPELSFTSDGTPVDGESAIAITVPFSYIKTGLFTYDESSGTYLISQYGDQPYIDGNTGEQIAVTNVLVLQTACLSTGDSLGHITVDLVGTGSGYFACGGQIIPITWSKADVYSPFVYTLEDGSPLLLGQGTSYINIIPTTQVVSWST